MRSVNRTTLLRRAALLVQILALAPFPRSARSATPLTTIRVAQGLSNPLFVTAAPGDTTRLFIVEQRGPDNYARIKILKNGSILPTPFLTVGPVATGGEQGLLGLAFPSNYATSGRFYVNYTEAGSGTKKVVRYTRSANPDVANPAGGLLLSIPQPLQGHNGGWMQFGPDGYLYLSTGDDGSLSTSQDLESLLGKILRLDVSGGGYTIPPGNPFAGATPGLDEIWSYGLRNPWRPSFDRKTGDLIIADVGEGDREEIDFAPLGTGAGANYGWPCFEGSLVYSTSVTTPCGSCSDPGCPKVFPVYEYDHSVGCSITGGYVYRGCAIPDLQGQYFFADYCQGLIFTGKFQGGGFVGPTDRTNELAPGGGLTINNITSFGEDARGEIYICDGDGEIFKIVPAAAVLESDMRTLRKPTALGDSLGSTTPGNALTPGIVPFTDAGSRIRGVGYLRDAVIRGCADTLGNCLTSQLRLGTFDIDLQACVDPPSNTLTRRFVFKNTAVTSQPLSYVDVITPKLQGDPDRATRSVPAGAGTTAELVQFDASAPNRWIVYHGWGSTGVTYSSDADTASELTARIAADQPLTEGTNAGPAFVGMALGFDFGSVAPAASETVTVVVHLRSAVVTGAESPPPPPRGELHVLGQMPFSSSLRLEIGLPRDERVSLDVFDLAGRRIRTLTRGLTSAGRSPIQWNGKLDSGRDAPSGVYFVKLRGRDWEVVRRAVLLH